MGTPKGDWGINRIFTELIQVKSERDRLRELAEKNEQAADALWAERDRLREALEAILDPEKAGVATYEIGVMQDIARAALQEAENVRD